jgi:hypothetical protein
MAIKTASNVGVFLLVVCLLSPWGLLGRYGASSSSSPMAASRGILCVPGFAASGDAVCIAPLHCYDYQNGWQQWHICSSPPILSSSITMPNDHIMAN